MIGMQMMRQRLDAASGIESLLDEKTWVLSTMRLLVLPCEKEA